MAAKTKLSEKWIRERELAGYGKGVGADYKPWIEVKDFSSKGKARRAICAKTGGRRHDFFSDAEWNLFLVLEHAREVIDIREQFPLDRTGTQSLAMARGIAHPIYPGTQVPAVMTCDFMVTLLKGGEPKQIAIACKTEEALENPRAIEKLEIERAYFNDSGIPHHLMVKSDIPAALCRNLEWCRAVNLEAALPEGANAAELLQRFQYDWSRQTGSDCLAEFCRAFDTRIAGISGTGLLLARHLLWTHTLETDLRQPDLPRVPMAMFAMADSHRQPKWREA